MTEIIEAHYTDNMKIKRPRIISQASNVVLPQKTVYSDREATKKLQKLNTDIYEAQQKEKQTHEFSFKTYLKIIAGIIAAAAGIACIRRIVQFFRKG